MMCCVPSLPLSCYSSHWKHVWTLILFPFACIIPLQLEQEIEDGVWYLATVSKEVLFRSRDRLGAKRAKPLWTEIIELLGDDYKHIRDQLYGEEDD